MKNKISVFILFLISISANVFAQPPEKMSYQAVIRSSNDVLIINQQVGMQISILKGSVDANAVYVETHSPTTNVNGLASIEIGTGTVVSGSFPNINWANDNYFIKTETDPTGGTSYNITGTSQLLSVPYAFHAKTSETTIGNSPNDFYLGQDTLGGIVFYIYIDHYGDQHGLIVSKTETVAQWQSIPSFTNAIRTWDGAYNTDLMINSPAKSWVEDLGPDWYLPSFDELKILYNNTFLVNKTLHEIGATLINWGVYWSSTENELNSARTNQNGFSPPMHYHTLNYYPKTNERSVRGIRAF